MCLLASMHIKCQCQRKVHAYRLLASMLVQMFSACMLTTYSAEMLFFRRAAAVSPPHKSLCGARLVCVLYMCGAPLVILQRALPAHCALCAHCAHFAHFYCPTPPCEYLHHAERKPWTLDTLAFSWISFLSPCVPLICLSQLHVFV